MKTTECASLRWIRRVHRGISACILCSAAALADPASANLIVNGGFETPSVPTGGYLLFSTGSSFSGWTVVGAPGSVGPVSGAYTFGSLTFPAQEGNQFLDLAALSNSATGIEQAVPTAAGTVYDLSFWVGNMVNPGGLFGLTSTVELFVEGLSLGTFTNANGAGTSTLDWKQFAISFTALDASTSIRFINRDGITDNVNGLDHLVLVAQGAEVPEPGSSALCATSLIALLLARRRKRGAMNPGRTTRRV